MAQSAFVALFDGEYFKVLKSWKPIPTSKFKAQSSWPDHKTKCEIYLDPNQKYFILSTEKTKDPFALSICSTIAVKENEAKEMITILEKSKKTENGS